MMPLSFRWPGPTATTVPSWGFSFAVSGRTIPLLVISSRAFGLIKTRSPSGVTLVALMVVMHDSSSLKAGHLSLDNLSLDACGSRRQHDAGRMQESCRNRIGAFLEIA